MKQILISLFTAGILYLLLSSSSSGIADYPFPYLNKTGSDGSAPGCDGSGCHVNSYSSNLSTIINVYNNQGQLVTDGKYAPNSIYTIKVHGFAQSGSYTKFGFQLSASYPNEGNFVSSNAAQMDVHVVGVHKVVEQVLPLNAVSNAFDATIYWQTPSAGDSVTLFLTMLGANDDGFATGDISNSYQATFKKQLTNGIANLDDNVKVNVFPNPAIENVNLKIESAEKGIYQLTVYNMNGQNIFKDHIEIATAMAQYQINSSKWAKGMYMFYLGKDGHQKSFVLVKE